MQAPEDWKEIPLSQVTGKKISYGIVQTGENVDGGIPCVRVVDLTQDRIKRTNMICTTQKISRSYSKTVLESEELMFALRGEIGLVRMVGPDLVGCNITRGIARISADPDVTSPGYLLWAIRSSHFRNDLLRRVNGSALQEIPLGELRKVALLVPPLPEQGHIAEILATWNRSIETVEKLITNSKAQKKALMQKLLTGKKRFKEFEGDDWSSHPISTVFDVVAGKSKSALVRESGSFVVVDMGAVSKDGRLIERKFTDERVDVLKKGDLIMPKDDIGGGQIIGRVALIPDDDKYVLGDHLFLLRCKPGGQPEYFSYAINQFEINKKFRRLANGTAQLGLSKKDVEKQEIPFPGLDEQKKIASVLGACDRKIITLQDQLLALQTQKKDLMQQLLTGKRRVKVEAA